MPINSFTVITKNIAELLSNTNGQDSPNSELFLEIRRRSFVYNGTIIPPTKTDFAKISNGISQEFKFECSGENLEQCKLQLKCNYFARFQFPYNVREVTRSKIIKAVTWVRMILAFRMYAAVRKEFDLYPYGNIDLIGSIDSNYNLFGWIMNRRVLFISNDILRNMIELVENTNNPNFWQHIFDIYDNLNFGCTNNDCFHRSHISVTQEPQVSLVDAPTHALAQEYLNRTDEEEIIFNNQQIADMVMRTKNPLLNELKNTIYEIYNAEITCSSQ